MRVEVTEDSYGERIQQNLDMMINFVFFFKEKKSWRLRHLSGMFMETKIGTITEAFWPALLTC